MGAWEKLNRERTNFFWTHFTQLLQKTPPKKTVDRKHSGSKSAQIARTSAMPGPAPGFLPPPCKLLLLPHLRQRLICSSLKDEWVKCRKAFVIDWESSVRGAISALNLIITAGLSSPNLPWFYSLRIETPTTFNTGDWSRIIGRVIQHDRILLRN